MKKIRCMIVDDEPLAISLLERHIGMLDGLVVVATSNDSVQALTVLKEKQIDLLFLDIQMPNLTGLELLKMLRHPPKVIITTAYREYAVEGYDLDIVDYLLKPITFDRFIKAVERYQRMAEPVTTVPEDAFIMIKSGYRQIRLNLEDILYIESSKDYLKVHTSQQQISTKFKISNMETDLEKNGFLRIHRSFIVRIKAITAFTVNDVEIGKTEIPIGESYKELVMKILGKG